MSTRRVTVAAQPNASALQKELHALKSVAAPAADGVSAAGAEATTTAPSFDSLSGVEKSAASLGVHPDSWRPIGFMNVSGSPALAQNFFEISMHSLLTKVCIHSFARRTLTTTTCSRATPSTTILRVASTYALRPYIRPPAFYSPRTSLTLTRFSVPFTQAYRTVAEASQ